jgi:hypothetical protein
MCSTYEFDMFIYFEDLYVVVWYNLVPHRKRGAIYRSLKKNTMPYLGWCQGTLCYYFLGLFLFWL